MKRKMLDLLLGHEFWVVWFEGHAVVTHSFWPMSTHLLVFQSWNFAILLVQSVVQRCLLYHVPGILDDRAGRSGRYGCDRNFRN
jgi:hypothetical protein